MWAQEKAAQDLRLNDVDEMRRFKEHVEMTRRALERVRHEAARKYADNYRKEQKGEEKRDRSSGGAQGKQKKQRPEATRTSLAPLARPSSAGVFGEPSDARPRRFYLCTANTIKILGQRLTLT